MWFMHMRDILADLSNWGVLIPALLITLGLGLLVACSMGCLCSSGKDKDDLFHHNH